MVCYGISGVVNWLLEIELFKNQNFIKTGLSNSYFYNKRFNMLL